MEAELLARDGGGRCKSAAIFEKLASRVRSKLQLNCRLSLHKLAARGTSRDVSAANQLGQLRVLDTWSNARRTGQRDRPGAVGELENED